MAKTIEFSYNGNDYTLEFTRATIRQMENEGFNTNALGDKPMTYLPALFAGAFKAHHRFLKRDTIDEIYSRMPDKDKLIEALSQMYNEPLQELLAQPEDESKNVDWVQSW